MNPNNILGSEVIYPDPSYSDRYWASDETTHHTYKIDVGCSSNVYGAS